MTVADGEPQAETYFAAGDKDQAMVAFRHAVSMVDLSPELSSRLLKSGLKPVWQLTYGRALEESERKYLGSFIKPIASDNTQAGPRPHCGLIDELHEIDRPTVVEMMRKAMGKNRLQPMIYEITNSGVDRHSICYQHRQQAERMLDGTAPNDTLFAYICGLDIGVESQECICNKSSSWDRRQTCPHCGDIPSEIDGRAVDPMEYLLSHEEIWVKANPGIGIVPDYEYVRQQILDALTLPTQRNLVLRLHFCVWTDAISVWIPDEVWMRGRVHTPPLDTIVDDPRFGRMTRLEQILIGKRCYIGMDLARTDDLSALMLIFPDDESGLDIDSQTYSVLEYYFCDQETMRDRVARDKVPYDLWAQQGHLILTPGNTFDPSYLRKHILEVLCPHYRVEAIAYDQTFAHQIVLTLEQDGLLMVKWGQNHWWMGAPVAEIARRAKAGLWRHRGHPITRWMMANVAIETDAGGLQKIDKARSREKVDGPVALANALGWCMRANKGDEVSAIERRGPIVIEDVYL
jgi:phage terminase large subunit-like protein